MKKEPRLEVVVYIPLGRTSKERKILGFVNDGARELDEDELELFASGADDVTDKSFNNYKKFSDKSRIEPKGDVNKDPMYRQLIYKAERSLIG